MIARIAFLRKAIDDLAALTPGDRAALRVTAAEVILARFRLRAMLLTELARASRSTVASLPRAPVWALA
jgi:hypothetical protein